MKRIDGGVTAPKGFRASGVAAGVKPGSTKNDCALVASDFPATVAGVFTKNVMKAPPIVWDAEVCKKGTARAVFTNSGNANACTGERGYADAKATAERVAHGLRIDTDEVCVCSTGVIGVPLPMDRINKGVDGCLGALSSTGSDDAARAIMTTDTVPKALAIEIPLDEGSIRLGAIAKGSGMIAPNMATMICIITTDAAIKAGPLKSLLHEAVNTSFNQICVDNDMSTSDIVVCLANGCSGAAHLTPGTDNYARFAEAFKALCVEMAQWLVRDGEGATKFVEIAVEGAHNDDDAKTIARTIAQSQLCKTAFFGQDPNWGRFACAAGYSGVTFEPDAVSIWLNDIQLMQDGAAAPYKEADAAAAMKEREFRIRVSVGRGSGSAVFWTSDLSHDYVSINADYRS
ncbi:MAG: bifunctional glutamate N-acetyltransferase/amino-acid acetyltransferase ArgJ [Candidatus Hydrogenedentes bacterium]|nr:bifunctional glutamate N-acetyltransferase/amino-acid acetyltransferase ArgJ [Candidatus Hydrogenedentota bacterium]